jgi:fumarate reductase subunit D
MRDLNRALEDISAIRNQMARGTEFRGYGPMTVAATAVLAVLAAAVQALWLPSAASNVFGYLALWTATALLSIILIAIEMVARTRRIHRGLADEMIHAAIEAFMPVGVAGALLTVVIYRFAPQSASLLPGLWQLLFSLGVFASCRSLPRPIFAVAVWYLASGLVNLALAGGDHAFSPLAMALPFGVGQLFVAVVLYRSIREDDAEA